MSSSLFHPKPSRNGFSRWMLNSILGVGALVLLSLLFVFLVGSKRLSQETIPQPFGRSQSDEESALRSIPQSPIRLKLSISHPPALGEQATLTISLISTTQAPGTLVKVSLPAGFKLVSGTLSWTVDLQPYQEQRFSLSIKAAKNGNWTIIAFAKHTVSTDPVFWFGDTQYLHLQVSDEFGKLGLPSSGPGEYAVPLTSQEERDLIERNLISPQR